MDQSPGVVRIVSGGQTGVDRAALDVAIALGIEHGGWCPRGRLAEDGPIDARYRLRETEASDYRVRTARNVLESDGTLILCRGRLRGGTRLTRQLARRHRKPLLAVNLERPPTATAFHAWLEAHRVRVLNIAGPRESQAPGIARQAGELLRRWLEARITEDRTPTTWSR